MKEERKLEYPKRALHDELQKMPNAKAPKFKPRPRLKPAFQRKWQALAGKANVLSFAYQASPCYAEGYR